MMGDPFVLKELRGMQLIDRLTERSAMEMLLMKVTVAGAEKERA